MATANTDKRTKTQLLDALAEAEKRAADATEAAQTAGAQTATLKAEVRSLKASGRQLEQQMQEQNLDEVVDQGGDVLDRMTIPMDQFVAMCFEEFPEAEIGKKPVGKCWDCERATKAGNKWDTCDRHEYLRGCPQCGNNHSSALGHIDYVGHADLTHRLIDIDPEWNWEPMGVNPNGTPVIDAGSTTAAMWIRLTLNGITRIGVGTCDRSKPDMLKELIGDALRNSAMRYGIALTLWARGDREWVGQDGDVGEGTVDPDLAVPKASAEQKQILGKAIAAIDDPELKAELRLELKSLYGSADEMRAEQIDLALGHIRDFKSRKAAEAKQAKAAAAKAAPTAPAEADRVDADDSVPQTDEEAEQKLVEQMGGTVEPKPEGTPENGSTAVSSEEIDAGLAQIRAVFAKLPADQATKAKMNLSAVDLFPLKKIKTGAQVEQAAGIIADLATAEA